MLTFIDTSHVIHLLPAVECHISAIKTSQSVEYKGKIYYILMGTSWNYSDVGSAVQAFNTLVALLPGISGNDTPVP